MMSKKVVIAIFILVLGILTVMLFGTFGKKPFAKLSADEIVSAELFIIPPNDKISIIDKGDISELTNILNEVTIYQEDNSGREYTGQLVQVTIELKNGEIHTIGAYGSFLFLNGKCYRTKYEPSQKLNAFGNVILNAR